MILLQFCCQGLPCDQDIWEARHGEVLSCTFDHHVIVQCIAGNPAGTVLGTIAVSILVVVNHFSWIRGIYHEIHKTLYTSKISMHMVACMYAICSC